MALLAVPNVSEGRDPDRIAALAAAFTAAGAQLLDTHSDADHHRTVFTLTGSATQLADALADGARAAITHIDLGPHRGEHPYVGALDVAPLVFTEPADHGLATATALVAADRIGHELNLPVFLYGELGGGRTRADLRRGGPGRLAARIAAGELRADFGPRYGLHPTAGATLVSARPPLVAFNLELAAPATPETARQIAMVIREGGPKGLPWLRAIGVELTDGVAQVSTNLEDWTQTTPRAVYQAVAAIHPVAAVELVGLAPAGAFAGFPADVTVRNLRFIEKALPRPLTNH